MKRYEFAPLVVPPDARRFLELPENEPYLPSFYIFYREYCHSAPDHPIVREINGELHDFSHVISTKMTRSRNNRSAVVLRATDGEHDERRYRLFVRPLKDETITEYDIPETRYCYNEQSYASHTNHSMLYLAVDSSNPLRQGVLEINGDHHYQSLWVIGSHEHLLEEIPRIAQPAEQSAIPKQLSNIIIPSHVTPPKAV